jgi:hypothetical protein
MRKIVLFIFLFVLSVLSSTLASAANTAASAARPAPASSTVTLTPEQARAALAVLDDPARRSQIEDTLRAVAAAGALSTPVQAASGSAAPATASAASGASGAASVLAKSLTSNGLASQISHEAGYWLVELSSGLRRSVTALLDYGSVMQWWRQRTATASGRDLIGQVIWSISISLLPAL